MRLTTTQRGKLRGAISEALAFRTFVAINNRGKRPTLQECERRLAEIRELSSALSEKDSMHAAIVDRCVDAIEEGLI